QVEAGTLGPERVARAPRDAEIREARRRRVARLGRVGDDKSGRREGETILRGQDGHVGAGAGAEAIAGKSFVSSKEDLRVHARAANGETITPTIAARIGAAACRSQKVAGIARERRGEAVGILSVRIADGRETRDGKIHAAASLLAR